MGLTFTKLMARLFSKKEMRILVRARAAARGARRVQCAPRLGCSARAIDRLTRPARGRFGVGGQYRRPRSFGVMPLFLSSSLQKGPKQK